MHKFGQEPQHNKKCKIFFSLINTHQDVEGSWRILIQKHNKEKERTMTLDNGKFLPITQLQHKWLMPQK